MTPWFCVRLAAISIVLTVPAAPESTSISKSIVAAIPQAPQQADDERRLPSGKLQREEILKADHQKNLEEVARIQELAREIEQELKEGGYAVLPRNSVRKAEEIEKLAKRIKGRLRR